MQDVERTIIIQTEVYHRISLLIIIYVNITPDLWNQLGCVDISGAPITPISFPPNGFSCITLEVQGSCYLHNYSVKCPFLHTLPYGVRVWENRHCYGDQSSHDFDLPSSGQNRLEEEVEDTVLLRNFTFYIREINFSLDCGKEMLPELWEKYWWFTMSTMEAYSGRSGDWHHILTLRRATLG